jgi:hypothetical protein
MSAVIAEVSGNGANSQAAPSGLPYERVARADQHIAGIGDAVRATCLHSGVFTMKKVISAAALALAGAAMLAGAAQAQSGPMIKTKYYLGSLNCNVSGSVGLIFGSSKDLSCVFVTTTGQSETYTGSIKRFGVDIGFTKARHILWNVYSLGTDRVLGALAGQFAGGQESLTVGGSAGTTGLFGGRNNEIILQSLSLSEKNTGLNFADGVAEMSLQPAQ